MKKTFHLPALICAGIAGAAIGVACLLGFYCAQFGGFDSYAAARKFSRVYNIIDRQYVGDADMQQIADGAYTGMVYATGDKWSMYLNADESKRMQEYSSNSYSAPAPSYGGYSAPASAPASDFAMLEDDDAQLPF